MRTWTNYELLCPRRHQQSTRALAQFSSHSHDVIIPWIMRHAYVPTVQRGVLIGSQSTQRHSVRGPLLVNFTSNRLSNTCVGIRKYGPTSGDTALSYRQISITPQCRFKRCRYFPEIEWFVPDCKRLSRFVRGPGTCAFVHSSFSLLYFNMSFILLKSHRVVQVSKLLSGQLHGERSTPRWLRRQTWRTLTDTRLWLLSQRVPVLYAKLSTSSRSLRRILVKCNNFFACLCISLASSASQRDISRLWKLCGLSFVCFASENTLVCIPFTRNLLLECPKSLGDERGCSLWGRLCLGLGQCVAAERKDRLKKILKKRLPLWRLVTCHTYLSRRNLTK